MESLDLYCSECGALTIVDLDVDPEWGPYMSGWSEGYKAGGIEAKRFHAITDRCERLENLLSARLRLDKTLPEERQKYINDFMDEHAKS